MESSGAAFFRGDLHIHSYGASPDCQDDTATPEAIVATAQQEGIAIADHNEIGNVRPAVVAGENAGVFVVPAVELSTPEGHLMCYAPTPDALERSFNRLDIADRGTKDCRCQTGTFQCLNEIKTVDGFGILAHIDSGGAFEANVPRFTPAKIDILAHGALEGFEVTNISCDLFYTDKDISAYKTLVPVIRAAKERRQVIVVTHDANIAVLGDAELIIGLKATNVKGKIVARGSFDHQSMESRRRLQGEI